MSGSVNAAGEMPQGNPDAREVVLAARNVAKSYGQVHALKGVNFDIHRGQVTTLFGENGAGKVSTKTAHDRDTMRPHPRR